MGFLSTLFNKSSSVELPVPDTSIFDWDNQPLAGSATPEALDSALGLIIEVAAQTVKAYGLPSHWFSFETVTVTDKGQTYFQLQISMNHWDMQMCAHSYAFERAVIKSIRKKNMDVGRALRAVLWRVAPDAGCPFDEMPQASYWSEEAIAQRDQLRERIQREFYAATTPESGAKLSKPAVSGYAPVATSYAPVAIAYAPGAVSEPVLENAGYSDTHPHNLNGFSLTHPHTHPRRLQKNKTK